MSTTGVDYWRPFEPSKDEYERIRAEHERNMCNLHDDCDAADRAAQQQTQNMKKRAVHCCDSDCEDCFGK